MSNEQKLLAALASELRAGTIKTAELDRMVSMLNGVNAVYHMELLLAAFHVKEAADA